MTDRETVQIDVVVLAWNDGEMLGRAVRSALRSEGVDVRLCVVDNGSDQPVRFDGCDAITIVRNERNLGVARGRNQGVRFGVAPLVCFLDSDAVLGAGALRRLADAVHADPTVALTAPVFTGQSPDTSGGGAPTLARKVARAAGLTDRYAPGMPLDGQGRREVGFVIGACQLFRRSVWEHVGGLDERYFYGPEDVDFCLRVRAAGWRILQVDGAECRHPPRRRNRRLLTRRGLAHARAVIQHLWRHRQPVLGAR